MRIKNPTKVIERAYILTVLFTYYGLYFAFRGAVNYFYTHPQQFIDLMISTATHPDISEFNTHNGTELSFACDLRERPGAWVNETTLDHGIQETYICNSGRVIGNYALGTFLINLFTPVFLGIVSFCLVCCATEQQEQTTLLDQNREANEAASDTENKSWQKDLKSYMSWAWVAHILFDTVLPMFLAEFTDRGPVENIQAITENPDYLYNAVMVGWLLGPSIIATGAVIFGVLSCLDLRRNPVCLGLDACSKWVGSKVAGKFIEKRQNALEQTGRTNYGL